MTPKAARPDAPNPEPTPVPLRSPGSRPLRNPGASARLARRVDWRFLLPGPTPRRVARVGRADDELDAALIHTFDSVTAFDGVNDLASPAPFDLLVLCSAKISDATRAVRLLPQGGTLCWEIRRGPSSRSLRRTLEAAGCEDVTVYWHRPDFRNGLDVIPIEEDGVLEHVFRGGGHGWAGEMRRAAGRWAKRLGQLDAVASCRSVLARKGGSRNEAAAGIPGALLAITSKGAPSAASRGALLMKTPRFDASSHVLLFVFPPGAARPSLVAKVPRSDASPPALAREAINLRALESLAAGALPGVPRLVPTSSLPGLLETVVPGREIHPARVRRDPDRYLEAVVSWLIDLHVASRRLCGDAPSWWADSVERPLQRIEALFAPGTRERELTESTRALAEPLRAAGVPRVFEHGDLSAPNLLLDEDRVGVVDWELGNPDGLPASDLFFFLTFVAFARSGANSTHRCREAFREAFFVDGAWTQRWVRRYAARLELDSGSLPALFVLTWARTVAGNVERMGSSAELTGEESESLRRWLRADRYYALWAESVQRFGAIRLGSPREAPR